MKEAIGHTLYSNPTVAFTVELARPTGNPGAWAWVLCTKQEPSHDHVYSATELHRAMLAYGALVAVVIPDRKYQRFRIVARGLPAQCMLAEYEWQQDPVTGRYMPDGEPWVYWPRTADLPPLVARVARLLGYPDTT